MATRSFVQTQVFVGPLWEPDGAACAWDWGRTADLGLALTVGSLATTMSSASSSVVFTGLTPAPKGGLWVGANGTGEAWEYIAYSSYSAGTASGLRRESMVLYEHNGAHTSGAAVRMWAPLDSADGKIHIVRESNDGMSVQKWSAELSGVLAPRALLRRHHAVLVRQRTSYSAGWTNLLLGWLDEYSVDDDYTRVARWKMRLISSAGMLEKIASPPLRSGELDLCRFGKIITQDVPLAAVHKEWGSGEFVEASPEITAKAAIDGDESTCWIPERVLGFEVDGNNVDLSYNEGDEANFGECFVLEANLGIAPGLGKGYRWIQLATIDGAIGDVIICNKNHEVGGLVDIGGSAGINSRIFIVENLNLFSAHNPLASPTRIKEVGSAFFDSFDMDNDGLAIWYAGLDGGANWRGKALKWRNPNIANLPSFEIRRSSNLEPDADAAPLMAGPYLPTPSNGEIYAWRRKTGTPVGTQWYTVDEPDTAGYDPGDTRPYPYFLVQLPGMGLALKAGLTAGYTGFVELWDGKTSQTNGLPASGTVQIGSEQMTYSSKTATGITIAARGANGTVAATHEASDSVLFLDGTQATDAFPVRTIRWRRRAGKPTLSHFKVYRSSLATQPRHPTNDDEDPNYEFENDYEKLADVQWNAASEYSIDLSANPRRTSWILFQISLMSEQPYRARLDSLEAILDTSLFDAARWLPEGATVGDCFQKILRNAGVPVSAITISASMPVAGAFEMMTAHGGAWAVLADLADYTGSYVKIDLLSRITVQTNPLWRLDVSQDPVRAWDRSTLGTLQLIAERSAPVAQIQMPWLNADGSLAEVLVYPVTADPMGDVQQVKGQIYPSRSVALDALARRYLIAKYPYTVGLQTAQGEDAVSPGEIDSVSWEFDDGTAARVGVVRDVEHTLEGLAWKTALRLVLYREAY